MKQLKLITETSYDFEISEGKNKDLYIVGIYSTAEMKNANGRIYKKHILEREVNKLIDQKIKNRCCYGQLNHPQNPETDMEKVAIMVEALEWKGNNVFGKSKVLKTPGGDIVKGIIESGGKIGISSRGLGTVNEDGYVNEEYQLISFDLVGAPSNFSSWVNGILESKTFPFYEENQQLSEEDKKKALEYKYKQIIRFFDSLK